MKNSLFLICLTQLHLICSLKFDLFSNLPAGEYAVKFNSIILCNPLQDSKMRFNLYVHENHLKNASEIKGNITTRIPFDDTQSIDISLAFENPSGGWKNNMFVQKIPKACSSIRKLSGNAWTMFMTGLKMINTTCPIPPVVSNNICVDTSWFQYTELPKVFIYGHYKIHLSISRNNEIFSCHIIDILLKHP